MVCGLLGCLYDVVRLFLDWVIVGVLIVINGIFVGWDDVKKGLVSLFVLMFCCGN